MDNLLFDEETGCWGEERDGAGGACRGARDEVAAPGAHRTQGQARARKELGQGQRLETLRVSRVLHHRVQVVPKRIDMEQEDKFEFQWQRAKREATTELQGIQGDLKLLQNTHLAKAWGQDLEDLGAKYAKWSPTAEIWMIKSSGMREQEQVMSPACVPPGGRSRWCSGPTERSGARSGVQSGAQSKALRGGERVSISCSS